MNKLSDRKCEICTLQHLTYIYGLWISDLWRGIIPVYCRNFHIIHVLKVTCKQFWISSLLCVINLLKIINSRCSNRTRECLRMCREHMHTSHWKTRTRFTTRAGTKNCMSTLMLDLRLVFVLASCFTSGFP